MTRFIVQLIETRWTKQSRGGPGAQVRNAVPEALRLKSDRPVTWPIATLFHVARYGESNVFASPEKETIEQTKDFHRPTAPLPGLNMLKAGQFGLYPTEKSVRVALEWSPYIGPNRKPIRQVLTVERGSWARLRCNFRVGGAREWTWWKEVVNVALVDSVTPDIFLASAPSAEKSFTGL